MLSIKGRVTKGDLIVLLRKAVAEEWDCGRFDFDIEDLIAIDIYEKHIPNLTDFELEFTVKKK